MIPADKHFFSLDGKQFVCPNEVTFPVISCRKLYCRKCLVGPAHRHSRGTHWLEEENKEDDKKDEEEENINLLTSKEEANNVILQT